MSDLLTMPEAAERFGIAVGTIHQRRNRGQLPEPVSFVPGRNHRPQPVFDAEQLREALLSRPARKQRAARSIRVPRVLERSGPSDSFLAEFEAWKARHG